MTTSTLSPTDTGGLGGHPRGLTTLFFTEMWERFSYYGMRAILVLYMVAPLAAGGLGWDIARAASVYGTYTMSVYLLAVPGGWLADKFLGAKRAVLLGGILIACGHFTMVFTPVEAFYAGLALIALGTGLLKPNISTLVGSLYRPNDPRRDGGFSIFYMGINIGAMLSPLVCGYLAQGEGFKDMLAWIGFSANSSWHWGFGAAGVGMTLGLLQFLLQRSRLQGLHTASEEAEQTSEAAKNHPLTPEEWKRIGAIFVLFFFTILFWGVYEQAGSSLNLFADKLTNNRIFGFTFPSSWYQSVPAFFVVVLAPVFSMLWQRLGERQPSSPAKFALGLFFLGLGFLLMVPAAALTAQGLVSPLWLLASYFLQVVGEMCLSPVGLSTVTKLAPAKLVGIMMGVWFLAAALGSKLAGFLASFFDENNLDLLMKLFGSMALGVIAAAAVLFLLRPFVKQLMGSVR